MEEGIISSVSCLLIALVVVLSALGLCLTRSLLHMKRQRSREQAKLIQAEKGALLSRMVAGITHDINSNIGVILSAFSYLEERLNGVHQAFKEDRLTRSSIEEHFGYEREAIEIVRLNLNKVAELVKSFKRLSADQASQEVQSFNVKEYLDQILLSMNPRLRKSALQTRLVCPQDAVIRMWPGAFSQIVTNLIDNALTHAFDETQKGTISIEFRVEGDAALLIVSDDGKGMEEAVRSRIFDPFFTTRQHLGGTGLGLFVVNMLVRDALKGSTECESSPGQGTRFIIRFPLDHTTEEPQQ